jgi:hypothetical protein
MTDLETILRRLRLVVAAVAALALLVMPSVASAKRHDRNKDRNHNGIPDKWEKRFHLKGAGVAKADPDKDGLNNRAEWLSHTNPLKADTNGNGVTDANEDPDGDHVDNAYEVREGTNPVKADTNGNGVKDGNEDADRDKLNNAAEQQAGTDPTNPDTDGDGVKDGNEKAGEVVAWDGTTLTLRLFGGQTVTGTVDENTWIDGCPDSSSGDTSGDGSGDDPSIDDGSGDSTDSTGASPKVHARHAADDPSAGTSPTDDPSTDTSSTDDPSIDDGSGDGSTDGSTDGTDGSGDSSAGCTPDSLKVGAVVTEASFSATPEGLFFDAIELKPTGTP